MRIFRLLRRYNTIALALLLTWALVMTAIFTLYEWSARESFMIDAPLDAGFDESLVTGDTLETEHGGITIYKSAVPNDSEAVRDMRLVDMKTGKITRVSDDSNALIYRAEAVGELGQVALVKTGMRSNRPIFNFIFVSFPNLERFVIARNIDALDFAQELDDQTFSSIVWDGRERARFIIVDAKTGEITLSRSMDFTQSGRSSGSSAPAAVDQAAAEARAAVEEAAAAAAPRNQFE